MNLNTHINDLINYLQDAENHLESASDIELVEGNWVDYCQEINKAAQLYDVFLESCFITGNMLGEQNKWLVNVMKLTDKMEKIPKQAFSHWIKGNEQFRSNKFNDARNSYSKALKICPEVLYFQYLRAKCNSKLRKHNEAILDYSKTIELGFEFPEVFCSRAHANYCLQNFDSAIIDLNIAIEIYPQYTEAYYLKGSSMDFLNDLNGAIANYESAIENNYGDERLAYMKNNSDLRTCAKEIILYAKSMDTSFHDGDKNNFVQTIQTKLQNVGESILEFAVSKRYRITKVIADSFDESISTSSYELDNVLSYTSEALTNQNDATLYFHRGCNKGELNDAEGGIFDLTKALEINPNYEGAILERGLIKSMQIHDNMDAIADFTNAIKINPISYDGYRRRAKIKTEMLDYEGAIADYKHLMEAYPRDKFGYMESASLKMKIKDYEGAIADFTRVIEIYPKNDDLLVERGLTYLIINDNTNALADLNNALLLQPHCSRSYLIRAEVKLKLMDYDGAIADLRHSLKLEKNVYNIGLIDIRLTQSILASYSNKSPNLDL